MKLRQIKRWDNNEVIFELECESDKELVETAVREDVSLHRADLSGMHLVNANMSSADISFAYMCYTDMSYANISYADMRSANMRSANMSYEDISFADIGSANMSYADISSANILGILGNMKELKSMHLETYDVAFTKDFLQIGCNGHLIEEWRNFSNDDIQNMDEEALEFWTKWKRFIFDAIELSFHGGSTKSKKD